MERERGIEERKGRKRRGGGRGGGKGGWWRERRERGRKERRFCYHLFFSFGLLIVLKNMTVFSMILVEAEGGGWMREGEGATDECLREEGDGEGEGEEVRGEAAAEKK